VTVASEPTEIFSGPGGDSGGVAVVSEPKEALLELMSDSGGVTVDPESEEALRDVTRRTRREAARLFFGTMAAGAIAGVVAEGVVPPVRLLGSALLNLQQRKRQAKGVRSSALAISSQLTLAARWDRQ
jgi:hypothetical protein